MWPPSTPWVSPVWEIGLVDEMVPEMVPEMVETSGDAAAPGRLALPKQHLRRERFDALFSTDARLTSVVAGAGTGKSMAIGAWIERTGGSARWVEPGSSAASGRSLWLSIADAFGVSLARPGDDSRTPGVPVGDLVIRLTEAIDDLPDTGDLLVIDGFDFRGPPLGDEEFDAAALPLFLRRLPPRIRVFIVGRRALPPALDRIRAQGEMVEVGFDELRFTADESAGLLDVLVPGADAEFVDAVMTAADGWAVPLALGANVWRSGGAGTALEARLEQLDRLVASYVRHEVLDGEDPGLVDLLVDVSVVDAVTAPLAAAITGRNDAVDVLERAEDHSLLVSRLGVRNWYVLHSAVRRVLVDEGERRDIERARTARRRAATWLQEHGDTLPALDQWLHVGDTAAALHLLADRQVSLYDAGFEGTVRDLVRRLAAHTAITDPAGMADLAWSQLLVDRAAYLRCVDEVRWWSSHDGVVDDQTARRLHGLVAVAALIQGELTVCADEARLALDGHPSWWTDPMVRTMWNNIARTKALDEQWSESSDEIRHLTVVLRRDADRTIVLEATRALGLALAGRPVDALRVAAGIRRSAGMSDLVFSQAELDLTDVLARHELGDAPDALESLQRLVELPVEPSTYVRAVAARQLADIHVATGSATSARAAFEQLRTLTDDEVPGAAGTDWTARVGVALSLREGDTTAASDWAARIVDTFWGPISRARIALHGGHEAAAIDHVAVAVPRCPRHELVAQLLSARLEPDRTASSAIVERAAWLAHSTGMLLTLAGDGDLAHIERVAWRIPTPWMDRLRRASANLQREVATPSALIDPLTDRERDVLRFLPSRLTLSEIAAELFISVNTLKFHLKVIYRKLGVNSRSEAAAYARSWGHVEKR